MYINKIVLYHCRFWKSQEKVHFMGAAILKIVHVFLRHAFSHSIIKPNLKVQSYFHYRYVIIIHNIDQMISNFVPKKKNYFYMRIKWVWCVVRHFRSKYFLKRHLINSTASSVLQIWKCRAKSRNTLTNAKEIQIIQNWILLIKEFPT